jgi:putative integral membrane protein (TIGR02587 family)
VDSGGLGPWHREVDHFVRAFSGAFLFAMPLLFTMEMWWLGNSANLWKLLTLLVVALVANLGLARFAGFREERGFGLAVDQAVDAVAVGVVGSIIVLLALNRIQLGDPLDSILGKIVVQAVPLSIGASAANIVFAAGKGREGDEAADQETDPWRATLSDVGATITGGIFIGFSIAPTEEIPMLASELTYVHQLVLIGLTFALTYMIVFESGFDPDRHRPKQRGILHSCLSETALCYVVSLLVSLAALYLFNEVDQATPLASIAAQTLVLGLPTAVGGAAGRLVI